MCWEAEIFTEKWDVRRKSVFPQSGMLFHDLSQMFHEFAILSYKIAFVRM